MSISGDMSSEVIDELVKAVHLSERILVLVGAGISVNAGIPDFRSADHGIYAKYNIDAADVLHIESFRENPVPFYQLIKEMAFNDTGEEKQFYPTVTHQLLATLKAKKKLLRVYSQNIDGLDADPIGLVPDSEVIQCHGNLASISCADCRTVSAVSFKEWISCVKRFLDFNPKEDVFLNSMDGSLKCVKCQGYTKPGVVLFGESLPETFFKAIERDISECDLLLVVGTSLSVYPFASIPARLDPGIPQFIVTNGAVRGIQSNATVIHEDCDIVSAKILLSLGCL